MFEKEIKFIVDFSLNKVKNLGTFFTFEKLLNTDIHPAILQYISAEIDFLIFEDRKKLIQNSVFDYSGPEIAKHFNQIGQEVKKSKKISVDDIKKLVTQAVSFNVNYVARPKWSITKLIYNDSDNKPIDEIKMSLNYLYFYEYIRNILLSYIGKKNPVSLSMIEFEVLLNKMDKELFASRPEKLIDNALLTIADFNNTGSNESKVPIQPVEIFFKERNLIDYLFKLRRNLPIEAKQKYPIEDIRTIIYSTSPLDKQKQMEPDEEVPDFMKENFSEISFEGKEEDHKIEEEQEDVIDDFEEPETETLRSTDELLKELKSQFEVSEPDNKEEIKEEVGDLLITSLEEDDLMKLYNEDFKSLEDLEKEIKSVNSDIEHDITKKENENELYDFGSSLDEESLTSDDFTVEVGEDDIKSVKDEIKSFMKEPEDGLTTGNETNLKSRKQNNYLNDLYAYLKDKEIDKIVKAVFDDDKEDFAITMDRIVECRTYDEATEILKGVFLTYRVNPYCREAVTLTNAVANYFNQV
jgi:CRISPR/Cas system-associated endoribonuclease Cas2